MKYIKSNNTYGQKTYNVEFIITRRIKGKKKFYLIKWEGYPITVCSWEPVSHLTNVSDMVKNFDDNFPNSINHKYLKEFKLEWKKYKQQKNSKKIKKPKKIDKNLHSNKIIIEIDDTDLNTFVKDEKKVEYDTVIKLKDIEDKNELIEKNNISNYFNNDGKLIRPILIW